MGVFIFALIVLQLFFVEILGLNVFGLRINFMGMETVDLLIMNESEYLQEVENLHKEIDQYLREMENNADK